MLVGPVKLTGVDGVSMTATRRGGGMRRAAVVALGHLEEADPATTGSSQLTCKRLLAYSFAVADVYKALADPSRRAILDELTDRNGQTLFELCARLALKHRVSSSRQAISQHLDALEAAGLVRTKRDGRYKFHFIDTAPLRAIGERWPIRD